MVADGPSARGGASRMVSIGAPASPAPLAIHFKSASSDANPRGRPPRRGLPTARGTGGRVFDEGNLLTVDVGDGTLSAVTRDAALESLSEGLYLVGNEVVQILTPTLSAPGVYICNSFLRGQLGTEEFCTGHVAGERFVKLQAAGIRRLVLQNSELGVTRYLKGVTRGKATANVDGEAIVCNGVSLKPYAPVDLRGVRDTSYNLTLSCQRRTRWSSRFIGDLGPSLPLGEETELYEWDLFSDAGFTVQLGATRTSTVSQLEYPASEQTTDGITPGDGVYVRVYQISQVVGRGYTLEGVV